MDAGIDWTWTTFPEFLDRVDALPKGINYAGYVGHSALRTYAMGERAFEKEASEDDLRAMERELRDAIRAGAIGFTTSRSPSHETPDRRPVASRLASWDEVRRLVGVMGDMNAGVFELAGERAGGDPDRLRDYHVRLRDLAVETGRPITWGLFSRREEPDLWRTYLALLEETAARGGRMFAQVHSRALAVVLSFKTTLPFDRLPVWRELRALPLEQQQQRLRDPELRRRLVEAARERDERRPIGAEARPASYEWIFVMDTAEGPHRSVATVARERGIDPVEAIIDLALEKDLDRFFLQPIANENQEHALELIKHPGRS
jgi:N-acyl-D-aspartate/D-glutamate deacylase